MPCSEKTGRLVERTCPALERERATKQTKRAARTVRAAERASSSEIARRTADGWQTQRAIARGLEARG